MSLKGVQHHLVHLCDVACANSEDDIAMMSTHRHHLCRGMHILHSANPILGRRVVKLKRLVHNGGGANRRIVLLLFTCGENAGDDHIIRLGQCFSEFTRKEHGPGEQVRLEDHANHRLRVPAARRRYPQSVIRVIFQPHLFSRTMFFASEFAEALAKADDVIVTGIFPAREKQEDYPTISSATIVDEALKLDHTPAEDWIRGVEDMHTAAQMMTMRAHHGDVIFTVGAGDITQMDEVMLHSLQAHRWDCEG